MKGAKTNQGLYFVAGGSIGSAAIGAAFWFVIAVLIDVEGYGEFSYYIAIGSILAIMGSIGLETANMTFIPKGEKRFIVQGGSLVFILGILVGAIGALINPGLGLFVSSLIFFNMSLSLLLGRRRYRAYSVVSIGAKSFQLVVSLVLFSILGFGGILLGYSLALLTFSFTFLMSLKGFRLEFGSVVNHRNFIVHTYATSLLQIFSLHLDKILIGGILGFSVLGIYTIGSQFLFLLATLPGAIYQYLLPQRAAGFRTVNIKKMSLGLSLILSLVGFVAAPILIENFLPRFSGSIPMAQIMLLALLPLTFTTLSRAELFATEKSRIVVEGLSMFILSLVGAQLALWSFVGAIGLAMALAIAVTSEAIYLFIRIRRMKM